MPRLAAAAASLLLCILPVAASAADGAGSEASPPAHELAAWVMATHDAHGRAYVVVDKVAAKVFAFGADGALLGVSPVLLGAGRGDDSPPGIGQRKLSTIRTAERITPAGRFVAALGRNLGGEDIVWIDYDAAVSMHRVVNKVRAERRPERLASPSPLDNRISYGCINVPAAFYEGVLQPIFLAGPAIVYVLPETRSMGQVFFGTPKG